jgi:hypothetical protein
MPTAELDHPVTSAVTLGSSTMKALVYHGPGKFAWEDKPRPVPSKIQATRSCALRPRPFVEPTCTF